MVSLTTTSQYKTRTIHYICSQQNQNHILMRHPQKKKKEKYINIPQQLYINTSHWCFYSHLTHPSVAILEKIHIKKYAPYPEMFLCTEKKNLGM